MQSATLRASRILTRLETRSISSSAAQQSRFLHLVHRSARPAFSPAIIRKATQARGVTTIPIQQGNTKVQHVTLLATRGRFFPSKFIHRVFLVFLFLEVTSWVFFRKSEDVADDKDVSRTKIPSAKTDKVATDQDEASQDENEYETITIDDEDAFFLPLTWPRRKPSVLYKAADEEWLEFCSFAKNGERQREVQGQAVEYALFVANHHPSLKRVLGKISPQSRYWLDIDYPLKYDDGYETTGIVVTDDFVALGSRDYDESTVARFQSIVSAIPVVTALWNITKAMFVNRESLTSATARFRMLPDVAPGIPDVESSPEFAKVLSSSIKQLRTRPLSLKGVPRGCVMVSGRIDIHGSKAWAEFAILGYYNPKENAWNTLPAIGLGPIRPVSIRPAG